MKHELEIKSQLPGIQKKKEKLKKGELPLLKYCGIITLNTKHFRF